MDFRFYIAILGLSFAFVVGCSDSKPEDKVVWTESSYLESLILVRNAGAKSSEVPEVVANREKANAIMRSIVLGESGSGSGRILVFGPECPLRLAARHSVRFEKQVKVHSLSFTPECVYYRTGSSVPIFWIKLETSAKSQKALEAIHAQVPADYGNRDPQDLDLLYSAEIAVGSFETNEPSQPALWQLTGELQSHTAVDR